MVTGKAAATTHTRPPTDAKGRRTREPRMEREHLASEPGVVAEGVLAVLVGLHWVEPARVGPRPGALVPRAHRGLHLWGPHAGPFHTPSVALPETIHAAGQRAVG
jgi:hypothetical protein